LGEFSSIAGLFSLGSFFENCKSSPYFCATYFFPRIKLYINFDRSWFWATFWAIFFTISSGHPASKRIEATLVKKGEIVVGVENVVGHKTCDQVSNG
jgi:hypothetical protein